MESTMKAVAAVTLARLTMILVCAWITSAAAQEKLDKFEDFATATGACSQSDIDKLKSFQEGFSYSVKSAPLLSDSGIAPKSVVTIPPLISFTCHGRSSERDLWLVSRTEDPAYCGWVKSDALLKSKAKRTARSKLDIFNSQKNDGVCGDIAPLSVADYCAAMKQLKSAPPQECDDEGVRNSSINAKFLIWNAGLTESERKANPLVVPIYATPEETAASSTIQIFSVLRIFDIARGGKGKDVYFLVGSNHRNMLGWVKEDSGTVWYTVLSTFFSPDGEPEIRSDDPASRDSVVVGGRPDNLTQMLEGRDEFARYPVLFDRRRATRGREKDWIPHLEIAYVGRFCDKRQLCAETPGGSVSLLPDQIDKSDVMFLIDATRSMQKYFEFAARAVKNVVKEEYVGSPDFQFGVALYGDYLNAKAMGLNDPLQFRMPIRLQPLSKGNEFDKLATEKLYDTDPVGGYEEAVYAALAKVARETPWRGDIPRFVIHIADDGDRGLPPQELLDVLKRQRIFYIPVAVRGDAHKDDQITHEQLVKQMQEILNRHVTPKGETIGVPKVFKTYGTAASGPARNEYDDVARALRGGISLGSEIRRNVMQALLKSQPTSPASGSETNMLPPGYARLTKAAMELFGIETDRGDAAQRTVAMKGYIRTAPVQAEQDRWKYYAAISPGDISQIKSSFEVLCKTITETSGADQFVVSAEKLLLILTGDTFESPDQLKKYFRDKNSIPLVSRTILGDGFIEMFRSLLDPTGGDHTKALQKEACRTALLFQRMDGRQRLRYPFERPQDIQRKSVAAGDLEWDDSAGVYRSKNAEQHDWTYTDALGNKTIFVPLDYLPRRTELR